MPPPRSPHPPRRSCDPSVDGQQIPSPAPLEAAAATFEPLGGESVAIRSLHETISKVAPTRANVLILGEPGAGSELVAQLIHANSPWRSNPFVPVRTASLEPEGIAAALFGTSSRTPGESNPARGLLEAADGGTAFIDDLTAIPLPLQAELTRVLDRDEIVPTGGVVARPVDLRLIAAVSDDPTRSARVGRLRHDLLARLGVYRIAVPPLRDRIGDIPALARHYLRMFGDENPSSALPGDTVAYLQSRPWSGNLQELCEALQSALARANGGPLRPEHFPPPRADGDEVSERLRSLVVEWVEGRTTGAGRDATNLYRELQDIVEGALLTEVLRQCGGRLLPAARRLGLTRITTRKLIRRCGITPGKNDG